MAIHDEVKPKVEKWLNTKCIYDYLDLCELDRKDYVNMLKEEIAGKVQTEANHAGAGWVGYGTPMFNDYVNGLPSPQVGE